MLEAKTSDETIKGALSPLKPFQLVVLHIRFKYKGEKPVIHLDSSSFQMFPLWHENLGELILTELKLNQVGSGAISNFPNLKSLQLHYLELAEIDSNAFLNCHQLLILNLNGNKLDTIP